MKLVSAAFIVTVHKHDLGPDLVLFPALEMLKASKPDNVFLEAAPCFRSNALLLGAYGNPAIFDRAETRFRSRGGGFLGLVTAFRYGLAGVSGRLCSWDMPREEHFLHNPYRMYIRRSKSSLFLNPWAEQFHTSRIYLSSQAQQLLSLSRLVLEGASGAKNTIGDERKQAAHGAPQTNRHPSSGCPEHAGHSRTNRASEKENPDENRIDAASGFRAQ